MTFHFIDKDWSLRSGVLATRHMPEKHSGVNIAERIDDIRKEFGIPTDHIV